ncbi:glycosyltransferase family 2 protein [Empedobacter sp. ULE_I136]
MNVFVIIVIYNGVRNSWIQKCFDSVFNSSVSCEIVAIDNNSSDNSVEYIKENYKNVHLIVNSENKGFGGANNQGIKLALELGGEYFFLLNQDAYVNVDTIEKLVKMSKLYPEFGVLSPMHLNGDGKKIDYLFSKCIVPNETPNLISDLYLNQIKDIYPGRANAAAWLLTIKCLRKVGGFNPVFFHYGEDSNYIHRLWYHNMKLGIIPSVFIYHDRESRVESKFDNKAELSNRLLLLNLSNPNNLLNDKILLKRLKYKLIKTLFLDINNFKKVLNDYLYFKKLLPKVKFNNKKVMSKDEFLFIKN